VKIGLYLRRKKVEKTRLINDLEKNTFMEEISLRKKSWAILLKEGDKNSKYFHKIANSHRRHNSIRQLSINGEISTDQRAIKEQIVDFYQHLFSEDTTYRHVGWLRFSLYLYRRG
jgi:hypothetical protein